MAAEADLNLDTKDKTTTSKRKLPLKKIIVTLLALGGLFGIGFTVYVFLFAKSPGKIKKATLPKEILVFTYKQMPEVHAGLVTINDEIVITEKEIERINAIEKQFPDQNTITGSEKKIWEGNLASLSKFMAQLEKEIQIVYVSFRVNQETGATLIESRKEELKQSVESVSVPSKELTDKLRAREEAKGFLEKTKDKLF